MTETLNDTNYGDLEISEIHEKQIAEINAQLEKEYLKKESFDVKKNRLETLQEKYSSVIFHKSFNWIDTELQRNSYKPLDSFEVGGSVFFAYMRPDCFLYIQMDKKGRTLNIFREVDFTSKDDIISTLETINDKNKVLHTIAEQRKNIFTRLSRFFLKFDTVFYGR